MFVSCFCMRPNALTPKATQPSIPRRSVNEHQLRLGRQRQVRLSPLADYAGCAGKFVRSLRTRAIPERPARRYTNLRLPLRCTDFGYHHWDFYWSQNILDYRWNTQSLRETATPAGRSLRSCAETFTEYELLRTCCLSLRAWK